MLRFLQILVFKSFYSQCALTFSINISINVSIKCTFLVNSWPYLYLPKIFHLIVFRISYNKYLTMLASLDSQFSIVHIDLTQ